MCQERRRNHNAISANLIQSRYMRHAFQELRGSWGCISFARSKSKRKSAYQSRAAMAKSMNLQRASARAEAARSNLHLPTLGCTETSQWMFRTLTSLYTKRRSRTKDPRLSTRLKSLIRSNSVDRNDDRASSSSLTDLIPSCVDFDLGNIAMSADSDCHTTGAPPSRRSSDSFLYPEACDSSYPLAVGSSGPKSPFRPGRHHRRKRSIFRAAKVALTGGRSSNAAATATAAGVRRQVLPSAVAATTSVSSKKHHVIPAAPTSSGIGIGRSKYSLLGGMWTPTRTIEKQHPPSPAPAIAAEKYPSRATTVPTETSSSPCKSSTTTSWVENCDMLTETFSTSSWSLRTDSPPRVETKRDSPRKPKLGTEEWRRVFHDDDTIKQPDQCFDDCRKPSSPMVALPISRKDFQKRQASAIKDVCHTGKDFQDAIVDIILDNDVNDLVDLEEFLHGYFRLNTLYQDIIQQFFNDLSDDVVNPRVSRAPSVFARLAAANEKSMAAPKAGGGRSREL